MSEPEDLPTADRLLTRAAPLVSIVTACFNAARYIEETIQSVLAQDYPRVEYIVMDGGSTDGTVEILKRYADRLKFVSEPDHGAADAINRGFALTHGEIFTYLNADDVLLPGPPSRRPCAISMGTSFTATRGGWMKTARGSLRIRCAISMRICFRASVLSASLPASCAAKLLNTRARWTRRCN